MCEYNDDLIRDFEEFDEKVPQVAKVIVQRGIDFSLLAAGGEDEIEQSEECLEAFQSIYAILREMVECTSEMTADEFEHYFDLLLTACELVVMVNSGIACEDNGNYTLTAKGRCVLDELEN